MKVFAVTSTRADWGLLAPVLLLLRDDPKFDLKLVVTGDHLRSASQSISAIVDDGFNVDHSVAMNLNDNSERGVTRSMAQALYGFADLFSTTRPDLMIVLGDRFEILAAATAALVSKIPVAHLCGGDVTEGAIDDNIRHCITKMSHLHFVTNAEAGRRVAQLGEDPKHIYDVGSPGLDRIGQCQIIERDAFFKEIGLKASYKNILVAFHPVTLSFNSLEQCQAMVKALESLDNLGFIVTGSNADPGGRAIDAILQEFVASRDNAVFVESLGSRLYFSALSHVDALVGNSSSGLYEAPSFHTPTVNIGDRQKGRLRASSVIDCEPEAMLIAAAIRQALNMNCKDAENPYGDGRSSERIVNILGKIEDPSILVNKSFKDLAG